MALMWPLKDLTSRTFAHHEWMDNVSSLNIYNLPLPHWNKISRWVRTLTKCPLGSLLWRKGLSVVEAENGLQGTGVGTPQGPPSLKGGPWVCGGPNGGGPCGGFPGRYILAL